MSVYEKTYEIRWFENGKINSRKFYNHSTIYDFKKYLLLDQKAEYIYLYYRNRKITEYNKASNMEWEDDYIIKSKIELIDMEVSYLDGRTFTFEDIVLDSTRLVNRHILLKVQIDYCLDTYPLNKEEFIKLTKEYNKINKYLDS